MPSTLRDQRQYQPDRRQVLMPLEIKAYTPSVQPGPYQAVCTAVDVRSAKDGSGDFRVWEFTLRDNTGSTGRRSASCASSAATRRAKGGKGLAPLLGHAPTVGETVEPVGKACTILVELNEDGYERVIAVAAPEGAPAVSPVRPVVDNET